MLMVPAPLCGLGKEKPIAADAHDAGSVFGVWEKPLQLMLMMLAPFCGTTTAADAHDVGPVLCV